MASSWPPKKNTAFDWYFFVYNIDGTVISTPSGLVGRYVSATAPTGGATAAPANVDATGGTCRISMTAAQMNSDYVTIKATSTTTGAVPTTIVIYTAAQTLDEVHADLNTDIGTLQTSVNNIPNANANADALIARNIEGGSSTGRTVAQALAGLRNKVATAGGTMTVYRTDDTTSSWTATVTGSASAVPIVTIDPA